MTSPPPKPQAAAGFCQQCGRPLTVESRRAVGQAVFCEPCLAAKLGTAPYPPPPNPSASAPSQRAAPSGLHPWAVGVLGFVPGAGAMYNEQYAKGIAHMTVFALLVALSDAMDVFGIFVAGWEFYMAIEAYHTAVARRDGLPLPNPFGLNDIADRIGFFQAGKTAATPPAAATAQTDPMTPQPGSSTAPPTYCQADWGTSQATSPFTASGAGGSVRNIGDVPYTTVQSPGPLVGDPVTGSPDQGASTSPERVPVGAVILILLGVLFLFSSSRRFHEVAPESLLGMGMVGLAGWIFVSHLRAAGDEPLQRLNSALRPAAWVFTTGLLAFLDASGKLRWSRSWPVFLITGGVTALLNRAAAQEQQRRPNQPIADSSR